jgi:diguanylate cyclase (GGDEF)-like protein
MTRSLAALFCALLISLVFNRFFPDLGQAGETVQSAVAVLTCALFLYLWAIRPMLREHRRALQQAESSAFEEPLTGLLNRRALDSHLSRLLASSKRTGELAALLYFDLDGFKSINDQYGHKAGDRTLEAVGLRLREITRADDTAFRIGGDEFILLIQHLGNQTDVALEKCEVLARKLSSRIAVAIPLDHHQLTVTASVGTTLIGDHLANPDMLMHSADTAMYELGLSWHRIAEIGCTEIDSDHAHLEALLIDAIEAQDDPVGKTRKLIAETQEHFLREQKYAADHGLNMTSAHAREHKRLSNLLGQLNDQLNEENLAETQLQILNATREHVRDYDQADAAGIPRRAVRFGGDLVNRADPSMETEEIVPLAEAERR